MSETVDRRPDLSLLIALRCLKGAIMGLVVGYCFAFLLGRFHWLEIRVNTAHVLPLAVACFIFFAARRRSSITLLSFLFVELIAACMLFTLYGLTLSAILTVPEMFFRDGFHLEPLTLPRIAVFLLVLFGGSNLVWICGAIIRRRGLSSR